MKNALKVAAFLVLLIGVTGCRSFTTPVQPPVGWIYTDYKAPLTVNYNGDDLGSKSGKAKTQYLLVPLIFINLDVAWGDAALREAAREGSITKVTAADYQYTSILGIYKEFTVIAHGN